MTERPLSEVHSPGLVAADGRGPAFELKFQLTPAAARDVLQWAREHLLPDPHGVGGEYGVTSVYCDTPRLDVFHRSPGYRRRKFRLRRYDGGAAVHLERKSKRGDRVKKRRVAVADRELEHLDGAIPPDGWPGFWFLQSVNLRDLRPTCAVAYRRTAFHGLADGAPVRLTLDRDLVGGPTQGWRVPPVEAGVPLLPDACLLELKFLSCLPGLFRSLLSRAPLPPARGSKYGRCVAACGLASSARKET